MRVYRWVWAVVTTVVVVSSVSYDVPTGGWVRLAVLGPAMAVFGALLGLVFAEDRHDRWAWARRGAVWLGVGATTSDALVAAWGGVGLLVGALLVGSSPAFVRTVRSRLLAHSLRSCSGPVELLATRDLIRWWDWTTDEVVHRRTSVPRRMVLVEERRRLLDELQRRDQERFQEWIAVAVPERPGDRLWGGERAWRRGW
ncbi:hypothetical protein [Nocardioides sp. zg-1228]|uniref:hypothetical protein n=1 Tax=Nocardioides sp. zg-1228 TaxID=2763008 RepID=UPI0016428911|nr:hypothetical protein [Nocardioides sp. zg-1228]MBC2935162.1 hypothetical protein [Nocardioides sp. zg-1228]QSF56102.1 hypothetical protein JX575_10450 [Nocardioides sp. zg-1228]